MIFSYELNKSVSTLKLSVASLVPVALGKFGCDVTREACWENSRLVPSLLHLFNLGTRMIGYQSFRYTEATRYFFKLTIRILEDLRVIYSSPQR